MGPFIALLHLFLLSSSASAAVSASPPKDPVVLLTDYGAVADGETNNAAAIVKATARCVALGGCTLLFPRPPTSSHSSSLAVYRTSSFVVPSHTTLWVPAGVQLRGTESDAVNLNATTWPVQKWVEWPTQPCMSCPYSCGGGCGPAKRAWLFVQNATNVTITGGGSLHGGGRWWWCNRNNNADKHGKQKGRPSHCGKSVGQLHDVCPPRMIHVLGSTDVRIHGIEIKWAPFWTVHIQLSQRVEVFDVSVLNPQNKTFSSANGDGFDVSSSIDVHVHNVTIDVSDDATAVRAGSGWAGRQATAAAGVGPNDFGGRCRTDGVVFEHIIVRNGHSVGRCGEDGTGGVRNVTWRDCRVSNLVEGAAVRFEASPTQGGAYELITFERITGAHMESGFSFIENHKSYQVNSSGGPYPPKVPGAPFPPITPQQPVFRNIVVRDVHLMDVTGKALGAFITLADTPVVGLTLANITLSPKSAKASETKPGGWSCKSGKGALAPVYACNSTATMLTPPLANPHGCALSCK